MAAKHVVAAAATILVAGCGRPASPPAAGTAPPPTGAPPRQTVARPSQHPEAATPKAVTAAVEAALRAPDNAPRFPHGVRVRSVHIRGDLVAIDFSPEFQKLVNMGDSTEGEAQTALCAALSPFQDLAKLSVTAGGKPVDSQMTDWGKPFPIRGSTGATG